MRNLLIFVALLASFNTSNANISETFSSYGEKLRPYFKKFLGKKRTERILGVEQSGIRMPKIPEVRKDARSVDLLKKRKDQGCPVVALNGAYKFCIDRGLNPSAMIMLDSREFNKRFVEPTLDKCKYFIA